MIQQLNGFQQAGPKWQFRSNFPSSSESAEICHANSCVKKCPRVFFPRRQNNMDKIVRKSTPPPPPPPPSVSKQRRISILDSQNTVRECCTLLQDGGGGGGGGLSRTCLKQCFPLWKKKQGHFFTEKESAWQISADSERLGKSLRICHLGPVFLGPLQLL